MIRKERNAQQKASGGAAPTQMNSNDEGEELTKHEISSKQAFSYHVVLAKPIKYNKFEVFSHVSLCKLVCNSDWVYKVMWFQNRYLNAVIATGYKEEMQS